MRADEEGQVLVLVDSELRRKGGNLGDTTEDIEVKDLRDGVSAVFGVFVSKGDAP